MRKLKKGFTLIELMVVIAIIGILATTLAPKLREQLAKAKDSKAVSFLGASRTVASSLIISEMMNDTTGSATAKIGWYNLQPQLDITTKGLISNGELVIGGSRNKQTGLLTYGGTIKLISATATNSVSSQIFLTGIATTGGTISQHVDIKDASDLHLSDKAIAYPGTTFLDKSTYSTEGKKWFTY